MPIYPKIIYVKTEKDSDGSTYLLAYKEAAEIAEAGEEIEIAIYNLSRVTKVKAKVEVE